MQIKKIIKLWEKLSPNLEFLQREELLRITYNKGIAIDFHPLEISTSNVQKDYRSADLVIKETFWARVLLKRIERKHDGILIAGLHYDLNDSQIIRCFGFKVYSEQTFLMEIFTDDHRVDNETPVYNILISMCKNHLVYRRYDNIIGAEQPTGMLFIFRVFGIAEFKELKEAYYKYYSPDEVRKRKIVRYRMRRDFTHREDIIDKRNYLLLFKHSSKGFWTSFNEKEAFIKKLNLLHYSKMIFLYLLHKPESHPIYRIEIVDLKISYIYNFVIDYIWIISESNRLQRIEVKNIYLTPNHNNKLREEFEIVRKIIEINFPFDYRGPIRETIEPKFDLDKWRQNEL